MDPTATYTFVLKRSNNVGQDMPNNWSWAASCPRQSKMLGKDEVLGVYEMHKITNAIVQLQEQCQGT